jgi:4a-hydroxytetrahydrobiopterin dehydratase
MPKATPAKNFINSLDYTRFDRSLQARFLATGNATHYVPGIGRHVFSPTKNSSQGRCPAMNACELADRKCVPCRGGVPPLKGDELKKYQQQVGDDWQVVNEHHLEKTYTFKNFKEALAYTNALGEVAEQEGHHPEITLTWGRATVRVWTHKIDGLTESDFILAAKADQAFGKMPRQEK